MADHASANRIDRSPLPRLKLIARPWRVTLLVVGVLTFAVLNLARLVSVISDWLFWLEKLPISPFYLAVSGAFWAITWFPLAVGLWLGAAWAGRFTWLAAWVYAIYAWLDRLLLRVGANPYNLPFMAGLTIVLLLFTYWSTQRPTARRFFIGV